MLNKWHVSFPLSFSDKDNSYITRKWTINVINAYTNKYTNKYYLQNYTHNYNAYILIQIYYNKLMISVCGNIIVIIKHIK